jgi:hypothetical protein
MRVHLSASLMLMMAPALLAGAAAADTAKIKPQVRALPGTKTECPSKPGVSDPTEGRALRPQPEPPGKAGTVKPLRPGTARGFNPQPEPPAARGPRKPVTPGETRGLRPQPEPPGRAATAKPLRPGTTKGFNPQPEPPGKHAAPPNPC